MSQYLDSIATIYRIINHHDYTVSTQLSWLKLYITTAWYFCDNFATRWWLNQGLFPCASFAGYSDTCELSKLRILAVIDRAKRTNKRHHERTNHPFWHHHYYTIHKPVLSYLFPSNLESKILNHCQPISSIVRHHKLLLQLLTVNLSSNLTIHRYSYIWKGK